MLTRQKENYYFYLKQQVKMIYFNNLQVPSTYYPYNISYM